MAKFVLVYTGGGRMGESPEEQQKIMESWMNWFGSLGESVVDGGAPFGAAATVASDGSTRDGGASSLNGYSIITADGVSDAASKAKGCPVLAGGGSVEIYEAVPMG
jgi:hypothetical protein